jgi:iron complex outermembrane receptor protein
MKQTKPRHSGVLVFVLIGLFIAAVPLCGEDDDTRLELEEIVVTGTPVSDPVMELPRNVTVITSFDIEQAPSKNIIDLLARESNVNLRSLFGHDKSAGIDIRGMGDTYGSNVIVMVDGFSINSPDMSGFDLSSIPLEAIERIEIVRGSGSVLYGDGAVGGVVNIITKNASAGSKINIETTYGSYNSLSSSVTVRRKKERASFVADAGYSTSDGYRDNGFLVRKDASVKFGYELTDFTSLSFLLAPHQDSYGLPGPVSREDTVSRERRVLTDKPDDSGDNTDVKIIAGMETFLGDTVLLQAHGGYRFRDDYYVMGYTPLLPREDQTDHVSEGTYTLKAELSAEYEFLGQLQELLGGIEFSATEYKRTELSKNDRKSSSIKGLGLFAMNRLHFTNEMSWNLGYRFSLYGGTHRVDQYNSTEEVWENGEPFERLWINHSFDTGLVYDINKSVSFFTSLATSFRTPNVDEFALSGSGLHPQTGIHIEAGSRVRIGDTAELAFTGFLIRIRDEIYYGEDPGTGLPTNRNYEDPTNRIGVEADLKLYPFDSLYVWGNYTFLDARFENRWTFVPLVPRHKASFGIEWQAAQPVILSVTGTYVGSRFDGNDENNDLYASLGPYTVIDAKLTYQKEPLKLFLGVNNLLDELYSTAAYSEQYYPMPVRNFYGGVELTF